MSTGRASASWRTVRFCAFQTSVCWLLAEPLVARGHVAVGVVVKAVIAADAVDGVVGAGIALVCCFGR